MNIEESIKQLEYKINNDILTKQEKDELLQTLNKLKQLQNENND